MNEPNQQLLSAVLALIERENMLPKHFSAFIGIIRNSEMYTSNHKRLINESEDPR